MKKIGVFYGSTIGDTKEAAEMIVDVLGKEKADIYNVASVSKDEVKKYDKLIFGASTWGLGELQEDWKNFIEELKTIDFSNKKVALFGFGDQSAYSDTFVDAIGIIYQVVKENGAKVVGEVELGGYDFNNSEAVINGKFVGLPLDDNNQSNLTEKRVKDWIENLANNF